MKRSLKTKRFTLSEQLREMRLNLNQVVEDIESLKRENESLSKRMQILEAIFRERKTQLMGEPKAG